MSRYLVKRPAPTVERGKRPHLGIRYAQAVEYAIDLLGYELESIGARTKGRAHKGKVGLSREDHKRLVNITVALTALGRSGIQRDAQAMLAPPPPRIVETTSEPIDYAEADYAAAGED